MKTILTLLGFMFPYLAFAGQAPATPVSIERLLVLTEVQKTIGEMHKQVAGVADGLMKKATKGKTLNAEDQATVNAALEKIIASAKADVSWEKMRDAYIPIYQENFTQEEVDGLIAFYDSVAGRALLAKMPGVYQEATKLMRERLVPVMSMIKEATEETAAKLK